MLLSDYINTLQERADEYCKRLERKNTYKLDTNKLNELYKQEMLKRKHGNIMNKKLSLISENKYGFHSAPYEIQATITGNLRKNNKYKLYRNGKDIMIKVTNNTPYLKYHSPRPYLEFANKVKKQVIKSLDK